MSYGIATPLTDNNKHTMNPTDANNHIDPIPAPSTARMDVQTQADVNALGLQMTLDEARLVLAVLSGMIARGRSKTRQKAGQMTSGLVACCLVESYRDGRPVAAAHPEVPRFGWPAGATALRRLGIDHTVIERYWARTRTRSTDASLPSTGCSNSVRPRFVGGPDLDLLGAGHHSAAARRRGNRSVAAAGQSRDTATFPGRTAFCGDNQHTRYGRAATVRGAGRVAVIGTRERQPWAAA